MEYLKDLITLYHSNKSIKTISDFMEREHIYNIEAKDFFDLNRNYIFTQMTSFDKLEYSKTKNWPSKPSDLKIDMVLPCPCHLMIYADKVTQELSISQTNLQTDSEDFMAFSANKIQEIYQNEGYKIANYNKRSPEQKVFGWFKTQYYSNKENISDSFVDLSKYIISMMTNVDNNGGSFNLRLPVLKSVGNGVGFMFNDESKTIFTPTSESIRFNDEYYHKSPFSKVDQNYFSWLISNNDLIFLSFDKLEMEKKFDDGDSSKDEFSISTKLSGNVYDMIGLVDNVSVITDATGATAYVEVTGRDLMKLLIEDGSFFFNFSTTSDPSTVFANDERTGKHGDVVDANTMSSDNITDPLNRVRRISNEIDIFANRFNMDISYILKGVISQLSNIQVVPDYVFNSWDKKDRTKFLDLQHLKK